MTRVFTIFALAFVGLVGGLTACPGAQVKGGGDGTVNVVLRRIDVVEAGFDKMKVNVIVAIENGTGSDISASADASLAIVGEATSKDGDDRVEEGAPAAEEGEDAAAPAEEAPAEEPTGGSTPIDGQRYTGRGSGTAAAYNTSELPITVELALPSDPALLEQVLDWKKMLIHVEGNVKLGAIDSRRLGGHREVAPPHLPEVKLKEAQVASVDDGKAGTGFFTLILDNKNPFSVAVDRMAWTVAIKDKVLQPSSGVLEVEKDPVPASAVSEYQTEVQINEAAFGKELRALLKNPTVPYVIEGSMEVRGIKRSFRFAGDMKFAR